MRLSDFLLCDACFRRPAIGSVTCWTRTKWCPHSEVFGAGRMRISSSRCRTRPLTFGSWSRPTSHGGAGSTCSTSSATCTTTPSRWCSATSPTRCWSRATSSTCASTWSYPPTAHSSFTRSRRGWFGLPPSPMTCATWRMSTLIWPIRPSTWTDRVIWWTRWVFCGRMEEGRTVWGVERQRQDRRFVADVKYVDRRICNADCIIQTYTNKKCVYNSGWI